MIMDFLQMVEINKKSEYKKNNYTIIKISIAIISYESLLQ